MIYYRFTESLALLLFLKNLSFRYFRHRALEMEFLYFCSGAFANPGVRGSQGKGLVPRPRGVLGIRVAFFPSPCFVSTPSPPQRTVFICVLNAASGQWLPHTHWKRLKLSLERLTHFTVIHSDSTTHKQTLSSACCLSSTSLILTFLLLSSTNLLTEHCSSKY